MKYVSAAVLGMMTMACLPESPELDLPAGPTIAPEEIVPGRAYTITQDSSDPNTIYLHSEMGNGYTALWEYPGGRSQKQDVTVKLAFAGTYEFTFGVMTKGGPVYGAPYTLELTTNNFAYVEDEMWTMLSGGRDNSKTWVLDIDADGVCRYFAGPLYFYGTDDCWETYHGAAGFDYNNDGSVDCWSWAADWAGNGSWLLGGTGAADYGSMTFDLIGGANITTVDYDGNEVTGTYELKTDEHILRMTDARLIHDPGRDGIVNDWRTIRVLDLTENTMMLGVIRDNDPSEGPCLLVYNFISKEYRDNWVPSVPEGPEATEPSLPDGWQDTVGSIRQTSIKWTLSNSNPIDWCTPAGVIMNGWSSPADYPDWLGTPDPSVYENFSLTMDSADNTYTAIAPDGTEVAGTYTLDEKGIYTFSDGLPSFTLINWSTFAADADNQLRIMSIRTDRSGVISDMWVGAKSLNDDGSLKEYIAYHLIANVGEGNGGGSASGPEYPASIYFTTDSWWPSGDGATVYVTGDGTYTATFDVGAEAGNAMVMVLDIKGLRTDYPASGALVKAIRYDGKEVAFDAGKVVYGDLEDNGNLRMELTNVYGPSNGDPAIDLSAVSFTTLEIDFEVKFEASPAQIMLTNDGWWPGYSGVNNAGVLGVGKHKITGDTSDNGNITAPMVFCLDILGFADANEYTGAIHSMKVNGKDVTVKNENLVYGDLEKKGNFRFEFFNIYGGTGNGVTSAPYDYSMSVINGEDFTDCGSLEMIVSITK